MLSRKYREFLYTPTVLTLSPTHTHTHTLTQSFLYYSSTINILSLEEKGTAEDEMVGWCHRLNGHEFEQVPRDGDGQESLACCSPGDHKDLDVTE